MNSEDTSRPCSCTPYPYGDGPEVDCPVHGLDPETLRWTKAVGLCSVGSLDELGQWLADRDAVSSGPAATPEPEDGKTDSYRHDDGTNPIPEPSAKTVLKLRLAEQDNENLRIAAERATVMLDATAQALEDAEADRDAARAELSAVRARLDRHRAALADALEGMEEMRPDVPQYFREKYGCDDYIARAKAVLAEEES